MNYLVPSNICRLSQIKAVSSRLNIWDGQNLRNHRFQYKYISSGREILSRRRREANVTSLAHIHIPYNALGDYNNGIHKEKSILVCGDGDLSFGAYMSNGIKENRPDVKLVASVLESASQHNEVYQDSERNIETIINNGHEVIFELDATEISKCLADNNIKSKVPFDRIQFNFPHWRGKSNNRKNRELVRKFLSSASSQDVLSSHGQIHLGLISHQAGMGSQNKSEWKCSWKPAAYAGEHDLLLSHVYNFQPGYKLSAYQWRDRPFHLEKKAQMLIFDNKWNGNVANESESASLPMPLSKDIQMYSFFTLFVKLPKEFEMVESRDDDETQYNRHGNDCDLWSGDQVLDNDFISSVIRDHIPTGIRAENRLFRVVLEVAPTECPGISNVSNTGPVGYEYKVAEYHVKLFGDGRPISYELANECKKAVEDVVQTRTVGTRRGGWPASHVFPSTVQYGAGW